MGGEVLDTEWKGRTGYRVRCSHGVVAEGVWPSTLDKGLCRTECSNKHTFFEAVSKASGEVLSPWTRRKDRHEVRCVHGNTCNVRPHSVITTGSACDQHCRATSSWDAFRQRVESLGGTVVEESYQGSHTPHRVRCSNNHECAPRPNSIQQGQGLCPVCASRRGARRDVFYVVASDEAVKFGITSGSPGHRLATHAADGLTTQLLVLEGLPGTLAPDLETLVRSALLGNGHLPIRGHEYFPREAVSTIMRLAEAATSDLGVTL